MTRARLDPNLRPTLIAVSSADGVTPVPLEADEATGALLTSGGGGGSGDASLAEQQTQTTHLSNIAASASILDDWDESDRAKVNLIVGQAGIAAGAGAVGATVPRVTLASDDPAVAALQLLDNAVSGAGFNITQINGVNVSMGNGASGTGVQRVTIANDSTGILAGITTVTTVTTVSTLTGGGIAHDAADSGNPHKIGFKAYSPDGTTPGTAVAEGDRTDGKGDLDGRFFVNPEHPRWWSYHSDGSSALTDASVQGAPGAGFQIVITEIIFSTGAATACNIFFEEGASKILGPWYLEAVAGRGVVWRGRKHVTANTAVTVTTSAAIAQSVDVQGYIQAV